MRLIDVTMVHISKANAGGVHLHDFHEAIFVSEGGYDVHTAEGDYQLVGGNMIYHPRGFEHKPVVTSDKVARLIAVQWVENDDTIADERRRVLTDLMGRFHVLFNWMHDRWQEEPGDARGICHGLLTTLSGELRLDTPQNIELDVTQRVIQLMRAHLASNVSVEDFAMAVGMSESHLSRIFRASVGMPPMKYLQKIRLEKAVHLLRHTDLPLKRISPQVGFKNEFYLSTLIKRHTGMSPRDYRRKRPIVDLQTEGEEGNSTSDTASLSDGI